MTPLRIGPPGRELVALHHPAAAPGPRRAALLCAPFGQEAVRTHRLLRVLADRLARDGHDVLRFDYFGTGDSPGDDEDADLDGWERDILVADEALRQRAGRVHVVWIGLRLGATAALRAAGRCAVPPERIVACEPVLDGARYLAALRDAHDAAQAASYSLDGWRPDARFEADDALDAIGFAVSRSMRAQIDALRPADAVPARDLDVVVVRGPSATGEASALEAAARIPAVVLDRPFDWTSEEAINASLVPADLLGALLLAASGR